MCSLIKEIYSVCAPALENTHLKHCGNNIHIEINKSLCVYRPQYLYFCTSKRVSICAFVPQGAEAEECIIPQLIQLVVRKNKGPV
jgi:hypothetical protein